MAKGTTPCIIARLSQPACHCLPFSPLDFFIFLVTLFGTVEADRRRLELSSFEKEENQQVLQSSLRHGQPRFCTEISMIAGGTGLTPCYQVLAAILRDPEDTTKVRRPSQGTPSGQRLLRSMERPTRWIPPRFSSVAKFSRQGDRATQPPKLESKPQNCWVRGPFLS